MKSTRTAAFAALLALSGAAQAQDAAPQEKPATATVQVKKTKLVRVGGDLVGKALVTPKNEPLGKVEDVIVHPRGDVAFLEFSPAGTTGAAGVMLFPVPWRALTRNEHGQFVLATTPDAFSKGPRHEKSKVDGMLADMGYWSDAEKHFGKIVAEKATPTEASTSLAPAKMLYLSSDLRSRSIENPDGEKVATLHELVLDPAVGRVAYAVLSVGGNAGAGEKQIAVPWEALKSMPDKSNPEIERLTLAATKEQLEKAPEFQATSAGWTTASEPDYVLKVYEFYSIPPYWIGTREEPEGDAKDE